MKVKLIASLALLAGTSAFAANTQLTQVPACNTVETCRLGKTCSCQVTANNYNGRYFYAEFTGLARGNLYQCKMAGDIYILDLNGSTLPQGVSAQCVSNDCPNFPVDVKVNAQSMDPAKGNIKLRYYVPPTDFTFPITFSCQ